MEKHTSIIGVEKLPQGKYFDTHIAQVHVKMITNQVDRGTELSPTRTNDTINASLPIEKALTPTIKSTLFAQLLRRKIKMEEKQGKKLK